MFGFSKKLPLTDKERLWIEESLLWLLKEFGTDFFLKQQLVLPEARFFPEKFTGSEECVRNLVNRICQFMDVDTNHVEVEFFSDRELRSGREKIDGRDGYFNSAAGLYSHPQSQGERMRISINESKFRNPTALVATIAHELGHVLLLGQRRISDKDESHEFLTDLLTVFFGLGIFTANSAFQFSQWQSHSHQGWTASRLGYMNEEQFAYSLAAYAWMRGDADCKWRDHLAINVKAHFKTSLNYLQKGGATSLKRLR